MTKNNNVADISVFEGLQAQAHARMAENARPQSQMAVFNTVEDLVRMADESKKADEKRATANAILVKQKQAENEAYKKGLETLDKRKDDAWADYSKAHEDIQKKQAEFKKLLEDLGKRHSELSDRYNTATARRDTDLEKKLSDMTEERRNATRQAISAFDKQADLERDRISKLTGDERAKEVKAFNKVMSEMQKDFNIATKQMR
jgi:hypothetical protein